MGPPQVVGTWAVLSLVCVIHRRGGVRGVRPTARPMCMYTLVWDWVETPLSGLETMGPLGWSTVWSEQGGEEKRGPRWVGAAQAPS